jgi:hypothetical protein
VKYRHPLNRMLEACSRGVATTSIALRANFLNNATTSDLFAAATHLAEWSPKRLTALKKMTNWLLKFQVPLLTSACSRDIDIPICYMLQRRSSNRYGLETLLSKRHRKDLGEGPRRPKTYIKLSGYTGGPQMQAAFY